ncbi:hypothetical protein RJB92_07080 [Staphylococcus hominis]|uniref:type II toxin-antitoxin system antitoxin TscA n=1 Tax=Staphylococcus hominis TaxID=1290 RepID=UPI002879A723|nr:hypothetical protein [Staphylococcus hominis]MDS3867945.1 hypothetical protein [Staphylococcus hominis]
MNNDQLEVMQDIYNTLKSVAKDKITEYKHTIRDGNNEWTETVNREEHLQAMIEWALQQIENNFEWED